MEILRQPSPTRPKNRMLGWILGAMILVMLSGSIAYIIWFKSAQ